MLFTIGTEELYHNTISMVYFTYGYGSVVTSAYPVEEVSGSCPGRVMLKTLKIIPTAFLFGVEHIRVRVGAVITFSR